MRRDSKSTKLLRYTNLEDRNLLAGDVSVVENGHLFIRGDELSNQIAIVADDSGKITVTGLRDTTINGSTDPFVVSGAVDLEGARGRNASFAGGLRLQTFGGHDRIDIQGIEFGDMSRIVTGEGDDFVRFIKSTSNHDFTAMTGVGDDTLNFVQTRVLGDFHTTTAQGHDSIRVRNSRTWGSTDVFSGAGNDTVTLDRVRLTGDSHRVITHDGNDTVVVRDNNVNESGLHVYAGDGRDHVFAEMNDFNEVTGEVVIAGQDGFDVIEVEADDDMGDMLETSGFVSGNDVEGNWYVYDRGDSTSDPKFTYRAMAVEFAETTKISTIDWLGSYYSSEPSDQDNFVVEIFESEPIESTSGGYWYRQPVAESSARFDIGNDANRLDTGEVWGDPSFHPDNGDSIDEVYERKIFSYSADIDFEFEGGKAYWVSIYSIREIADGVDPHHLNDDDFSVLVDFPGEPGEYFEYEEPTGTEADPFPNTTTVRFDDNVELGIEPDRWYFTTSTVETIFALNP